MYRASLILLLLLGCSQQYPKYRTLQVNYIEDGKQNYLFLNVKETEPNVYQVLSQEIIIEDPTFVITEIFDYNSVK